MGPEKLLKKKAAPVRNKQLGIKNNQNQLGIKK